MMKLFTAVLSFVFCFLVGIVTTPALAAVGDIVTVAGGALRDGAEGKKANVLYPSGVAVDGAGSLYIADTGNNRIRKIASNGTISTVVGSGSGGFFGDGGSPLSARLRMPTGVAFDSAGNMYIADQGNHRIRIVEAGGNIRTLAGNGTAGFSGDDGPAEAATLNLPYGIAVDKDSGDIYFSDQGNQRIRKISAATDEITTVAGNGTKGVSADGVPATSAGLWDPAGVAVDDNGDIYVADQGSDRIRKITVATGMITSLQWSTPAGVTLDGPSGVAVAGNDIYIVDLLNQIVRKVSGGTISTVAGTGTGGYYGDGGPATAAYLRHPAGIAVDSAGDVYLTEHGNDTVRKVTAATGIIDTVAGGGKGDFAGDDHPATDASLSFTWGVALKGDDFYIADRNNNRIRKVSAATGKITTIAGIGSSPPPFGDGGPATAARIGNPKGVVVSPATGDVYIADTADNRIRMISAATGNISTIAGTGAAGYSGDGDSPTAAALYTPTALALSGAGDLYIADEGNHVVRKISGGKITTLAGTGGKAGFSGDGAAATAALLNTPCGVAVDSAGNVYIADMKNGRIRKVTTDGNIDTVAGTGTGGYSGEGFATQASLYYPAGVAVDGSDLYIADQYNHRIRKVSGGRISTVAGNGMWDYAGDGGPAKAASLAYPTAVAVDGSGNIFIADRGNKCIRKVIATVVPVAPGAPTGVSASAGNGQATVTFSPPAFDGDSAITGYTVVSHPAGGVDGSAGSTSLSPLVTGLTNGTSYTFTVTATNSIGTGSPSAPSNPVIPATVPDAPSIVSVTAGNAQVTVTFSAPASNGGRAITGYTVTSAPAGGVDSNNGTTGLSHVVTGLTNGTPYTFTVTATNGVGTGTSAPSGSVTPATVPDAPVVGTATGGNGQATVRFSPPGFNGGSAITGYTVASTPGGGTDSNAGSLTLSHVITGLTNGTPYSFTVTATNRVGSGPASAPSNSVTPRSPPGAPRTVAATAGNARATVTFAPPASDGGNAITGYTVLSNPAGGVDSNAGSLALSHAVTGLKNGTGYTFTVVARNAIGTGAASAASNRVTPLGPPGAPVILSAKGGNAQATVTFAAPASNGGSTITGYTVFSSPLGGVDMDAGTTRDPHIVTGLKNGTAYVFTVFAKNALGTSPSSANSNVVTPATVPDPPTAVTAKAGNARASVTFAAPLVNGGSRIIGYTVLSSPSGGVDSNAGSTGLPHIVTGLKNGTTYVFTVIAKNAVGVSRPSLPSNLVEPATVPDAPTAVTAKAGDARASVTFAAPLFNGGSPITGYTVYSNPAGGIDNNAENTGLPHIVTGLENGVTYTFTVVAKNAVGTGAASLPSNRIVPAAPPAASGVAPGFAGGETGTGQLAVRPAIKPVRRATPAG